MGKGVDPHPTDTKLKTKSSFLRRVAATKPLRNLKATFNHSRLDESHDATGGALDISEDIEIDCEYTPANSDEIVGDKKSSTDASHDHITTLETSLESDLDKEGDTSMVEKLFSLSLTGKRKYGKLEEGNAKDGSIPVKNKKGWKRKSKKRVKKLGKRMKRVAVLSWKGLVTSFSTMPSFSAFFPNNTSYTTSAFRK
ncbi:uncharacterized protein LOC106159820 [Lingula anatina]|uniref:Uncharacterized protein LOC106159820 n=1 Tax=Lingula anatina TaxID=7574 RepID=A0A1S3I085_LINAN|nr:uncharacterized protein LOC106159820 [Lingula anatina]|eukprot:XP_013391675.1 uncharacterized protein LOC106159820 [Lingula anatina]